MIFFPLQISLFIFIAELHFDHFETSSFGRSILNAKASVSSHFQTSRKGLKENKAPLRVINELRLFDVCFVEKFAAIVDQGPGQTSNFS